MKTLFALLAEYESVHIPLEEFAKKYLGIDRRKAFEKANTGQLPFPALRLAGQKSP
ncbi:pyocin activator PrtN family protein, partial [Klebsiella pneumoniae]|uniref:pyocin activator PrtN family protein n=1 Tax=Klebsiella pneumoniae TaxID=573 RepID=UPI00338FA464